MSKCRNDIFLEKIGVQKLTKNQEVTFKVLGTLPDCKKINTRYAVAVMNGAEETTATYNRYDVPENMFECMGDKCVNTGTLTIGANTAIFYTPENAIDWADGVLTFYVKRTGTGNASAVVKISDTKTMENADSYTIALGTATNGFYPVVVDLSKVPTTVGDGWEPSVNGAYIAISLTGETNGGISSIAIFDSITDFEINDVVKIACLTSIDGDVEIPMGEDTCFEGGQDTSDLSFEKTVTGKALTPNYKILNPMFGRGSAVTASKSVTVERVVEAGGLITIADANQEDCGNIAISAQCDPTENMLVRLSFPYSADMPTIDDKHFVVEPKADGTTVIHVNELLVGQTVTVVYPRKVEVEEWVADDSLVGGRKVQMSYHYKTTDGAEYIREYRNVYITTFPDSITEDEVEFSFTIAYRKDSDGYWYHDMKVVG